MLARSAPLPANGAGWTWPSAVPLEIGGVDCQCRDVTAASSVEKAPLRVVVCDDDELFAEGLSEALSRDARVDVVGVAHDGKQALELVHRDSAVDVLLLDIEMPRMDGIETLRVLRQEPRRPAVMMLTGVTDSDLIERAHAEGPDAFLRKSVDAEEVTNGVLIVCELVRAAAITAA